ncbi:LysR substrate-binding domain-containing protein [Cupriavidus sp. D39]|uniref:LysR family transcriptional regulator n=1 Tax=Cupriavidus sp. D39 TaxID=2997877 RepID=UPI00226FEE7E|nr:LysR substrate-binding domain-containing protein [Cupriavidus sp. D39]MCY0853721.1 LysR substrate-binding domain-containing protein [Cupriavidus sp. D39]
MRMRIDLTDMRLFVNIADGDSLTRGAERSQLSLPAASGRIKHLEIELGTRLLHRGSQGVTLTPPGKAFAHHARRILRQLDALDGDMQEYAQGIKGHLRVAASTTAITEFLPAVLRGYLARRPDVNVDLHELLSGDIVRAVADGQTDIGIVSGLVSTEWLEVLPYRQDRLVLAAPVAHPLGALRTVRFWDTLEFDQIGLQEANAIHNFVQRQAQQLHRAVKLRIQVRNFEVACRMVEAGVGVSLMPESAARRYGASMALHVLALEDDWALRNIQLCMRSRDELPPFARELVEALLEDSDARR